MTSLVASRLHLPLLLLTILQKREPDTLGPMFTRTESRIQAATATHTSGGCIRAVWTAAFMRTLLLFSSRVNFALMVFRLLPGNRRCMRDNSIPKVSTACTCHSLAALCTCMHLQLSAALTESLPSYDHHIKIAMLTVDIVCCLRCIHTVMPCILSFASAFTLDPCMNRLMQRSLL